MRLKFIHHLFITFEVKASYEYLQSKYINHVTLIKIDGKYFKIAFLLLNSHQHFLFSPSNNYLRLSLDGLLYLIIYVVNYCPIFKIK